jgi:hypothetical protein
MRQADRDKYRQAPRAAEKQVTRARQPPDFMICATWAAAASNSELKEREVRLFAQLRAPAGKNSDLRLTLQPVIDVLARLILGQAIALLDEALELLAPSADRGQIVFGELPPLLFDPALRLFPISFDAVPIHSRTSVNPDPRVKGTIVSSATEAIHVRRCR